MVKTTQEIEVIRTQMEKMGIEKGLIDKTIEDIRFEAQKDDYYTIDEAAKEIANGIGKKVYSKNKMYQLVKDGFIAGFSRSKKEGYFIEKDSVKNFINFQKMSLQDYFKVYNEFIVNNENPFVVMDDLNNEISDLKVEVQELEEVKTQLEKEVKTVKQDVKDYETICDKLEIENKLLKQELEEIKSQKKCELNDSNEEKEVVNEVSDEKTELDKELITFIERKKLTKKVMEVMLKEVFQHEDENLKGLNVNEIRSLLKNSSLEERNDKKVILERLIECEKNEEVKKKN